MHYYREMDVFMKNAIHGSWTRVLEILRESGYNTVQENRRGGDPMPELEIEELKSRFVQALSPVSVYLFGSYADGSYTGESDFDFYIVVEDSTDDLADLTTRAYQSIRNVKQRPVDILVSTKSKFDYRKTIPSVENDVYRKGVLLYGR